jgi:hypothetical protein
MVLGARIAFATGYVVSSRPARARVSGCHRSLGQAAVWQGSPFVGARSRGQRSLCWHPRRFPSYLPKRSKREHAIIKMNGSDEGPSVALRAIAAFLAVGLIATSFGPLLGAFKSGSSDGGEAFVDAKLHKVPVFTVTDATGRPFLVESEDHKSRQGYFFVDPKDASTYLERVRDNSADAKLLPVGLDEALKYVLRSKSGLKDVPERFTLLPSEREVNIAKDVTDNRFESVFGNDAVPLFYVDGLALAGSGERAPTVYPVFFEKETLDKTLAALRAKDAAATSSLGDMQVIDLMQTIREIKSGNNPRLGSVIFLPLEDAVNTLKETAASK